MLSTPITVTLGGTGGTARSLSRINQDSYSAEYLSRTATDEVRLVIRHSKEAAKTGYSYPIERHNVLLTQTVFATATQEEHFRQVSVVIRCRPNDDESLVIDVGEAATLLLSTAMLTSLVGWES